MEDRVDEGEIVEIGKEVQSGDFVVERGWFSAEGCGCCRFCSRENPIK